MRKVMLFVFIGIVVYFLYIKYKAQTATVSSGSVGQGDVTPPSPISAIGDVPILVSGGGSAGGGGGAFFLPPNEGGGISTNTSILVPPNTMTVQAPTPAPLSTLGSSMLRYTGATEPAPLLSNQRYQPLNRRYFLM